MKIINTTIRISTDNENWSPKMTLMTFTSRYKDRRDIKSVEISEVVNYEEAKDLILNGLLKK